MKILVLGKSGQVAQSLLALASADVQIEAHGRDSVDLMDPDQIENVVVRSKPDAIINAAAYTAVDQAEDEPQDANVLNHRAVAELGNVAQALKIPLVHISTDYVFDGSGDQPRNPDETTNPLGVYGITKRAGETALLERCDQVAILRTSWVFSSFGNNFVKTMLSLGRDRDQLNIVADQIGGPTPANDIARACVTIAQALLNRKATKGIWHFSGTEDCSWADFAEEIFSQAKISCQVNPIPTSDYPTKAKRPLNSRLDCTSTTLDFGIDRPSWKVGLSEVLTKLELVNEGA